VKKSVRLAIVNSSNKIKEVCIVNILLINTNPVVSRLFHLAIAPEKRIELDEVTHPGRVNEKRMYDIIFVDDGVETESFSEVLAERGDAQKIFISYATCTVDGFDALLKKPFLPSQVTKVIAERPLSPAAEGLSAISVHEVPEGGDGNILSETPQILDHKEVERIKALLEMEEAIIPEEEEVPERIIEGRKAEAILSQLIAEGVEIVKEEEIVKTVEPDRRKRKKGKRTSLRKKEYRAMQKALKEALSDLRPKEVRKLLKGKAVTFKLKLKDSM
jgi:hypothetical protein